VNLKNNGGVCEMRKQKKVVFSEWKVKHKNYYHKGLSSTYHIKEIVLYRDYKISEDKRIEEGILISHKEKNITLKEKEYKAGQEHLIGYHYISLISDDKDVLWIQGNITDKKSKYVVFNKETTTPLCNLTNKDKAMRVFKRELLEKYGLELRNNL